jgi:hypothetical protein
MFLSKKFFFREHYLLIVPISFDIFWLVLKEIVDPGFDDGLEVWEVGVGVLWGVLEHADESGHGGAL